MLYKYLLKKKKKNGKFVKFLFKVTNKTFKKYWMIDPDSESAPTLNVSQCPLFDCSQKNLGIPIMNLYVVDKKSKKIIVRFQIEELYCLGSILFSCGF